MELGNLAEAKVYSGKARAHSRPDLVKESEAYEIRDARLAAISPPCARLFRPPTSTL
jgi:hypothetical protein